MLTGKENTEPLCDLLHAHIAPTSGQAIKRARKNLKDIRGTQHAVTEEDLGKRVPAVEPPPPAVPIVLPTEISADEEAEISPATAVESPASTEQ